MGGAAGPSKLIELADIRGDLHSHTNETDGRASLEEMAEAARQRGLKYLAITDHSQRVSMARGLDAKRLLRQWAKIDRLNAGFDDFVLLKGIECDILERGGLDLPDDVLAQADWVNASIHYGQRQSRQQITQRILEALEHPHVTALAHPTGRLIHQRPPYEMDLEAVFKTAKEHRKFLELNASPMRLDLNDVDCAAAKAHGILVVISTDAHVTAGLDDMRYGVLQARRGGLTKADIVNTRHVAPTPDTPGQEPLTPRVLTRTLHPWRAGWLERLVVHRLLAVACARLLRFIGPADGHGRDGNDGVGDLQDRADVCDAFFPRMHTQPARAEP